MLILKRVEIGKPCRAHSTEACGLVLPFDVIDYEGVPALACRIPDDHPQAAGLRSVFGRIPGFDVISEAPPVSPPAPAPLPGSSELPASIRAAAFAAAQEIASYPDNVARASEQATKILELARGVVAVGAGASIPTPIADGAARDGCPEPIVACLRGAEINGWTYDDLTGTGKGDPGPTGGFSPVTGLTLAQMALCVPPSGWAEKRATHYPWEIEGWTPPGQGWIAPAAPAKRSAPAPEEKPPEGTTPTPTGLDVEGLEGDDADGPSAYDLAREAGAAERAAVELQAGVDPAVAAGYPAAHVAIARELVHRLQKESQTGRPLTYNKANYAIRKLATDHGTEIETVTEDQLAGLLALPPAYAGSES